MYINQSTLFSSVYCSHCQLVISRPWLYVIVADKQVLHRLLQCVAVLGLFKVMYCQLGCLWIPVKQFSLCATQIKCYTP